MAKVRSSTVTYRVTPISSRVDSPDRLRAKVFANGRSQAVRLPKSLRFTCSEVFVRQEGESLILEPIPEPAVDAKGRPIGFWKEMDRWREGLDLDDFQIPDDPVPPPIRPMDAD